MRFSMTNKLLDVCWAKCSANGRHAFSLDGKSWRYASVDAYHRNVTFWPDSTITVNTRARPFIILDPSTGHPQALATGLKETMESGYVWTLVQPLRQRPSLLVGNHEDGEYGNPI